MAEDEIFEENSDFSEEDEEKLPFPNHFVIIKIFFH